MSIIAFRFWGEWRTAPITAFPFGESGACAERGFRLVELSLKVFPLCGENISFGLNWEKVARMRRKRGAFILEIRADFIKQANFNG